MVAPAALPGLAATAVALKSLLVALVRYGQESLVRLGDARKLRALLRLAYRVQHLVPPDERRRMSDAATLRRLVQRQALRHARHELLPNGQALPGTLEYRVLRDGERLAAVLADELLRTVLAPPVALNVHPAAYRAHASTRKTTLRQERFHVLRASFGLNEHRAESCTLLRRQLVHQLHHALGRVFSLFLALLLFHAPLT